MDASKRLYWAIQWRRNEGLGGVYIVLLAFIAFYVVLFPGILTPGPLTKFLQAWFPTALVAAAETIVMLTGGIDLAVGSMVSLGSVIAASLMAAQFSIASALIAVIATGGGVGLIVGYVVTVGGYPAIVVTLATSFIIRGVALLILSRSGGYVPQELSDFLAGDQPTVIGILVVLLLAWKVCQATPLGMGIVAAGDNSVGAYRSGVSVTTSRIFAYCVSGMLQAFAGFYIAARTGVGDPLIGEPLTLAAITAAVLGGVGFFGGVGTMRGAICGALLLSVIINVMFFMGLPPVAQYIVQGLIIVGTVTLPRVSGIWKGATK